MTHIVSTPFQTIVEEDKHKTTQKNVTHVSVHTLTFHETHHLPPGNTNTIQYLISGRATNVELLKQVKNWQSPSRDPWSNCLINSRETTKGQTNCYSGREKDNSKTICGHREYVKNRAQRSEDSILLRHMDDVVGTGPDEHLMSDFEHVKTSLDLTDVVVLRHEGDNRPRGIPFESLWVGKLETDSQSWQTFDSDGARVSNSSGWS